MGKSLGNSAYLRDLYKQYDPLSLRFTILQSHYRGTTEFTEDAIRAADTGYQKLIDTFNRLQSVTATRRELNEDEMKHPWMTAFMEAMDNDFNTPQAISILYRMAKDTNTMLDAPSEKQSPETLDRMFQYWRIIGDSVLGIFPTGQAKTTSSLNKLRTVFIGSSPTRSIFIGNPPPQLGAIVQLLIKQRKAARDRRDFATSDSIRKELEEAGIILEDTKDGTTWRLK